MLIVWLIIGYFAGSIPFSYLVPKLKGIDVSKIGSGNIGGTNVLRSMGPIVGISCMLLDFFKAFIPTLIALLTFGEDSWIPHLTLLAAVIGHDFPIWLKFKGGKGVASTVGGFFALNPLLGIIFFTIWFPVNYMFKYVSLASLVGLLAGGLIGFIFNLQTGLILSLLFLLSLWKHKKNVKKILSGEETVTDILKILSKGFKK
ncbi:MAG: glycerol-3-phosphate 1-O-acyltransferase PlsY [Thermotogota bacterium]